jgi:phosphatidylethanolamine-binding protein (PEBP) family uncharacterized protein
MAFILDSPAFGDGDPMPASFRQSGENRSPPLAWRDPPPGTLSFALVLESPNESGRPVCHWAVYDIPADRRQLPQGDGAPAPYDGPLAARRDVRRTYRFRLAALDVPQLDIPATTTAVAAWQAAKAHLIREAELVSIDPPGSRAGS